MERFCTGLIACFLLCGCANAAVLSETPASKLNIAQVNQHFTRPESHLVRVGIGTNGFSSYLWQNAVITAKDSFKIYNNKTLIGIFDKDEEINITTVGKIFVVKNKNGEVIAKVSGPLIFKSPDLIGIKGLKRAGQEAFYRGEIEIISNGIDKFYIVNELELEQYLRGVVPNEMPVSFGLEALKAQAVAARNYVLSPRIKANVNYDVVDSVASQVYFGAKTEKELSDRAVKETSGIVALHGWNLILAQYSSTSGGYTESFENAFSDPITKKFPSNGKPYLVATPDYEDVKPLNTEQAASEFYKSRPKSFDKNSSYFRWEREWNGQEIQDAVQANIAAQSATGFITPAVQKGEIIGIIKHINVTKRGNSGKIIELQIVTDEGTYTVQKELIIRRLFTNKGKALPSANVVFEHEYNENGELIYIKAYGGGFGHGVGMSQYGAGFMGRELHKSYAEILKHYYNGIILATTPVVLSSANKSVTKTFYTKNATGVLVVDNKYQTKCLELNINGTETGLELDTKERYNTIDLSQYLKKGLNTVKVYYPEHKGGIRFYIEICD